MLSSDASDHPPSSILVVGGSARFLAASCHRAGWKVFAADRFGDADLRNVASGFQFLPIDLLGKEPFWPTLPSMPFLFTGGLENTPAFLEQLALSKKPASASVSAIRAVRDHRQLASIAQHVGLQTPQTCCSPEGLPSDGSFLLKPLASVGGHGIQSWRGGELPARPSIWQRRHDGIPYGVNLVLAQNRPARLLGIATAVRCRTAANATGWNYAGSVTVTPQDWVQEVVAFAGLLSSQHSLSGAVGVDCIRESSGQTVVLEVNPRPTSSMELVERTDGVSIAASHLKAFDIDSPQADAIPSHSNLPVAGKAILYAEKPVVMDSEVVKTLARLAERWSPDEGLPAIADLPPQGCKIKTGSPLLTIFADGDTTESVERLLEHRLKELRTALS
jgi:predicted ATP-grasp superfamily ATP-dependent carboligase